MKPIDYIYKNLDSFNISIFKQIVEESGETPSEDIYDYLMETTWNTNPALLKQFGLDIERSSEDESGEEEEKIEYEWSDNLLGNSGAAYYFEGVGNGCCYGTTLLHFSTITIPLDSYVKLMIDDYAIEGTIIYNSEQSTYYIGAFSTSDSETIKTNKIGCVFSRNDVGFKGIPLVLASSTIAEQYSQHSVQLYVGTPK